MQSQSRYEMLWELRGRRDYFRLDDAERFLEEVASVFSLQGRKRGVLAGKKGGGAGIKV